MSLEQTAAAADSEPLTSLPDPELRCVGDMSLEGLR
jgi:hypothetical protein